MKLSKLFKKATALAEQLRGVVKEIERLGRGQLIVLAVLCVSVVVAGSVFAACIVSIARIELGNFVGLLNLGGIVVSGVVGAKAIRVHGPRSGYASIRVLMYATCLVCALLFGTMKCAEVVSGQALKTGSSRSTAQQTRPTSGTHPKAH